MTEIKGEYKLSRSEEVIAKAINCKRCGKFLGAKIIHGDQIYLLIGSHRITSIQSKCKACGEQFAWWSGDDRLERLTKKSIDDR